MKFCYTGIAVAKVFDEMLVMEFCSNKLVLFEILGKCTEEKQASWWKNLQVVNLGSLALLT